MDSKIFLNSYRIKRLRDKTLVVTDQGFWAALSKKEFVLFSKEKPTKETEEAGLFINKNNINRLIAKKRINHMPLFNGTSLHILVLTLRCNLKCSYCHSKAKSQDDKKYDMDKKTARKIVDFIFQSPSKSIKIELQGGEPLLNFEVIKEIIEYSKKINNKKKKDLQFALVTNLTEMDDEKIKYIIKNKIGLCTSLDGPSYVHDKIRRYVGGKGSYKNVVSWIKTIKEVYKYPLSALMVTTKYSLPYPKEIVDEYVRFGFDRIQLKFMSNLGYAQNSWKSISYTPEQYLVFWKKAIDYIISLNLKGKNIQDSYTANILKKILTEEPNTFVDLQSPCGAAISQLAYDYNGDIYTCDEGRQYELFKLGNVFNDTYKKILTSDETASIIACSTNDCFLCDACVYKPYCGLCPVCCYAETGNLVPKLAMDNRCKILKGIFDYIFEKLIFSEECKGVFLEWVTLKAKQKSL